MTERTLLVEISDLLAGAAAAPRLAAASVQASSGSQALAPAADSRCPISDLTDPRPHQGLSGRCEPKALFKAAISTASPNSSRRRRR